MNRKITWLLALFISVSFGQMSFADNNSAKSGTKPPCICKNKLFKKLDLTPEQQTQIKAIRDQANASRVAKKKEMVLINNKIEELIRADNMDEAKLDALLNQKKEVTVSLIKNKIMVKHQMYNILSAQQKAKYDEILKNWEKNRSKN